MIRERSFAQWPGAGAETEFRPLTSPLSARAKDLRGAVMGLEHF